MAIFGLKMAQKCYFMGKNYLFFWPNIYANAWWVPRQCGLAYIVKLMKYEWIYYFFSNWGKIDVDFQKTREVWDFHFCSCLQFLFLFEYKCDEKKLWHTNSKHFPGHWSFFKNDWIFSRISRYIIKWPPIWQNALLRAEVEYVHQKHTPHR